MRSFRTLFIIALFSFSCYSKNLSKLPVADRSVTYAGELEWSTKSKLAWEDFKAVPPTNTESNLAAVTHCGFGFSSNRVHIFSKPKFIVTNVFNRNASWVDTAQKNRPELLEHEQLHFDISEVYARLLRKELNTSQITYFNLRNRSETVFQKVYKAYLQRQELYEQQTAYSLNAKKQTEWVSIISTELALLNAYSKEDIKN